MGGLEFNLGDVTTHLSSQSNSLGPLHIHAPHRYLAYLAFRGILLYHVFCLPH